MGVERMKGVITEEEPVGRTRTTDANGMTVLGAVAVAVAVAVVVGTVTIPGSEIMTR